MYYYIGLLGLSIQVAQGGLVQTRLDDSQTNDTELMDPKLTIPLKRGLDINLNDNETELMDPALAIPLRRQLDVSDIVAEAAEDRADNKCGCGTSGSSSRIVKGKEVKPMHSRPYQVYLQSCSGSGCYMCGATLLNKRYALTAMHCIVGNGQHYFEVAVGEHNIEEDVEHHTAQAIKATLIKRSDYDDKTMDNDIALLRLSKDVEFNDGIVPACLPTDKSQQYGNWDAVVSGWGGVYEKGPTSDVLKETDLKILPDSDAWCINATGSGSTVPKTMMCAYKQGTDSCQGDSGGPLVVKENGKWTVVGVVSYGDGCARYESPGVYARVTNYLDWINDNIKDGWCSGNPEPAPEPVSSLSCRRPCDLGKHLWNFSGSGIVDVKIGFWPVITAKCDLSTKKCCPTDKPKSNLCRRLRNKWIYIY